MGWWVFNFFRKQKLDNFQESMKSFLYTSMWMGDGEKKEWDYLMANHLGLQIGRTRNQGFWRWVAKQHTKILECGLCYITFLIKEEKKEKLPLGWIFLAFLTSYWNTTILYNFYKIKFQNKTQRGYPHSRWKCRVKLVGWTFSWHKNQINFLMKAFTHDMYPMDTMKKN